MELKESGAMEQIISRWQAEKFKCSSARNVGSPLGINKLFSLFLLIITGCSLSSIILILECLLRPKLDDTIQQQRILDQGFKSILNNLTTSQLELKLLAENFKDTNEKKQDTDDIGLKLSQAEQLVKELMYIERSK